VSFVLQCDAGCDSSTTDCMRYLIQVSLTSNTIMKGAQCSRLVQVREMSRRTWEDNIKVNIKEVGCGLDSSGSGY
jgi:hypothetical protein